LDGDNYKAKATMELFCYWKGIVVILKDDDDEANRKIFFIPMMAIV
jgi:hypothetical protein